MSARVIIVESDEACRAALEGVVVKDIGAAAVVASGWTEALRMARQQPPDLMLLGSGHPGVNVLEILKVARLEGLLMRVVLVMAGASVETVVAAVKAGAFDIVEKPVNVEEARSKILRALEDSAASVGADRHILTDAGTAGFQNMMGQTEQMQAVFDLIRRVAPGDLTTVLITGESGTGKDMCARAIHSLSPRRRKPFVHVECACFPEHLLESELFGHEQGAFTDARQKKQGLLEVANSGTIFLDELADLSLPAQAKLLGVLEKRRFRRVGGTTEISIDVRVIAATNRDLKKMMEERLFRQDLYYRIGVVSMCLPTLRERRADISLLVDMYLKHFNRQFDRQIRSVSEAAMAILKSYSWPGNVRELRNVMERGVLLCTEDRIVPESLPPEMAEATAFGAAMPNPVLPIFPETGVCLSELERGMLLQALVRASGNQSKAARLLSISRDTMRYRMKKYEIARAAAQQPSASA